METAAEFSRITGTQKMKSEISIAEASQFSIRMNEICSKERKVNPRVLRSVIELAIELAREGLESRHMAAASITLNNRRFGSCFGEFDHSYF